MYHVFVVWDYEMINEDISTPLKVSCFGRIESPSVLQYLSVSIIFTAILLALHEFQ